MLMMINQYHNHDDHLQQSRPGYSDPGRPSGCASLTWKHIDDKYDNDHIVDHDIWCLWQWWYASQIFKHIDAFDNMMTLVSAWYTYYKDVND